MRWYRLFFRLLNLAGHTAFLYLFAATDQLIGNLVPRGQGKIESINRISGVDNKKKSTWSGKIYTTGIHTTELRELRRHIN
jgi:hypothetical protein